MNNGPANADELVALVLDRVAEALEAAAVTTTPRSRLDADRLRQGGGAVLSARRAAELLPVSTPVALEWLEAEGLVYSLAGARLCVWADICARLRSTVDAQADRDSLVQLRPRRRLVDL